MELCWCSRTSRDKFQDRRQRERQGFLEVIWTSTNPTVYLLSQKEHKFYRKWCFPASESLAGNSIKEKNWVKLPDPFCNPSRAIVLVFSTKLPFISDWEWLAAFVQTEQDQITHTQVCVLLITGLVWWICLVWTVLWSFFTSDSLWNNLIYYTLKERQPYNLYQLNIYYSTL